MADFNPEYRHSVMERIANRLFSQYSMKLRQRLSSIIRENNNLHAVGSVGIDYKGTEYFLPISHNEWEHVNVTHESMVERMEAYLLDKEKTKYRKRVINNYLINGLLECNTMKDLYNIFPDLLHNDISPNLRVMSNVPCHDANLSIDEVSSFKEINKEAELLLKEQVLLNMLLK